MRIIPSRETPPAVKENPYVAYVQRFDVVPQLNPAAQSATKSPESASSLYVLKRARRADNSLLGDIVPINQLRGLASLIPRFGEKADPHLNKTNSLFYTNEFWLNKYFNKEMFFALTQ